MELRPPVFSNGWRRGSVNFAKKKVALQFNQLHHSRPKVESTGRAAAKRNDVIENRPGALCRLVTWLVQLPRRSRTHYAAPILREIKFVNSLKQYSFKNVWKYPLNYMGPPQHHATLGPCPGTPTVRCCAAHAVPLPGPPLSGPLYCIQLKGYFRLGAARVHTCQYTCLWICTCICLYACWHTSAYAGY